MNSLLAGVIDEMEKKYAKLCEEREALVTVTKELATKLDRVEQVAKELQRTARTCSCAGLLDEALRGET